MILEAPVNLDARAAFVSEKLDDITLANHPNGLLLAGPIG
jgi:hypothetical protein